MKTDDMITIIGRIKSLTDQYIIDELTRNGVEGIVPSHGNIVLALRGKESLSMSEIATKIGKDPSTVTTLVKKLSKLGYVVIYKDEIDKRVSLVKLTSKSNKLLKVIKHISEDIYKIQYIGFSEAEITTLRTLLTKVQENFNNN